MSEIVSVFKDIAQLHPHFHDQITNFSINQVAANVFDEPDKLADFAAAVSTGEVQELQDVLESLVVDGRLRKALLVLKKELINAQLQSKLSRDVDTQAIFKTNHLYFRVKNTYVNVHSDHSTTARHSSSLFPFPQVPQIYCWLHVELINTRLLGILATNSRA